MISLVKVYDIMSDIIVFLWYHIWYHKVIDFSAFLALFFCDIAYDIIYISYKMCYDIGMLWYWSWFWSWYDMIWPPDIGMLVYHSHVISRISWYVRLYHGTCAAGWRWLGPPGARCSTSSGLAIAYVLRTGVQLNGDGLDPAHGLVAQAAARVVRVPVVVPQRRCAQTSTTAA